MALEREQRFTEAIARERGRLRNFIRSRVRDPLDAEDVLQDVLHRLWEANRLLMPVEHLTGWLYAVARNRITDRFRARAREAAVEPLEEGGAVEDLLPSPEAGPEARYARSVLIDELEAAVDELPEEQREVFVAHELEGRSFREMSEESGVSINTLLSRKRYAVLRLRERLREVHDAYGKE